MFVVKDKISIYFQLMLVQNDKGYEGETSMHTIIVLAVAL
jgi:hypothetical protein